MKSRGIKLVTEIKSFHLANSQSEDMMEEKTPFIVRTKEKKIPRNKQYVRPQKENYVSPGKKAQNHEEAYILGQEDLPTYTCQFFLS